MKRKVVPVIAALAAYILVGCSTPTPPPIGAPVAPLSSSSRDYSQDECETEGFEWVGGNLGCLNSTELAIWKESDCADQDYYTCQRAGFKSDWVKPNPSERTPETRTPPPILHWSCWYEPTMNDDWYDDVVCSNGVERHRPYLREWDSFVTVDEIMESAREYEQYLNGN